MKTSKKMVCTSLLFFTLIVPTPSYASNTQSSNDQKYDQSFVYHLISFFKGNSQSVTKAVEVSNSKNGKEYSLNTDTFYIGDKKFTSKEIEKYYQNRNEHDKYLGGDNERDHDHDHDGRRDHHRERDEDCNRDRDRDKESKDFWRDCYDWDWNWFWDFWKKP